MSRVSVRVRGTDRAGLGLATILLEIDIDEQMCMWLGQDRAGLGLEHFFERRSVWAGVRVSDNPARGGQRRQPSPWLH